MPALLSTLIGAVMLYYGLKLAGYHDIGPSLSEDLLNAHGRPCDRLTAGSALGIFSKALASVGALLLIGGMCVFLRT